MGLAPIFKSLHTRILWSIWSNDLEKSEKHALRYVPGDSRADSQLCSISSRQKVVDTPLREPCWTTKSSNTFERHAVRATGHRSLSQVTGDAFGIGDI